MAAKKAKKSSKANPRGLDDIGKGIGKAVGKAAKKAAKDVADPKYKKKVYDKKGGLKKNYKDYVLRNSKGMF